MAVKESVQSAAKREISHAVKLFGMKISLSVGPADEDQAPPAMELAKSEVASTNPEDIASCSDDDKAMKREEEENHSDRPGSGGGGGASGGVAEVPRRHRQQEDKKSGRQLKRPDKPVPCPRCSSLDTKFCYFNNYNVNQPRHFCKNCQRYWTAGGTLRNVPVGAGRRKNKSGGGRSDQQQLGVAVADPSRQEMAAKLPAAAAAQPSCRVSRSAADAASDGSFGFIRSFASRGGGDGGAAPPGTGSLKPQQDQQQQDQHQQQLKKRPQHSVSGTSEGSSDSRDDSTCVSSVSNPVREPGGGGGGGGTGPAATNWPYALFSGSGPWNLPAWNAWSSSPWGNIAATAATAAANAAAKVLAQNVHTALGKHLRDEKPEPTADTDAAAGGQHKRPAAEGCLWAPKTLRIDAGGAAAAGGAGGGGGGGVDGIRRGGSFLADIAAGCHKVDAMISTGGMFKAFQQAGLDANSSQQQQQQGTDTRSDTKSDTRSDTKPDTVGLIRCSSETGIKNSLETGIKSGSGSGIKSGLETGIKTGIKSRED